MKNFILGFTLLITLIFSSSFLYANWTLLGTNVRGDSYYIDLNKITEIDGYTYFFVLLDYIRPTKHGYSSVETYRKGNCKMFQYKYLSFSFYEKAMGVGRADFDNTPTNWVHPSPNSGNETILRRVCDRRIIKKSKNDIIKNRLSSTFYSPPYFQHK